MRQVLSCQPGPFGKGGRADLLKTPFSICMKCFVLPTWGQLGMGEGGGERSSHLGFRGGGVVGDRILGAAMNDHGCMDRNRLLLVYLFGKNQ